MRNSKLKSLLQVIAILSVVASLLLCLNGCKKKKPEPTESRSMREQRRKMAKVAASTPGISR